MHVRWGSSVAAILVGGIIAPAVVVGVAQAQATADPDHILKGTAPTITITLDKDTPSLTEIKKVHIRGQDITVQPPNANGKLSVPLPNLDEYVGTADLEVVGKDNKTVAITRLTYVEGTRRTKEFVLLFVYIGFIVLLPLFGTIYDIRKSYAERTQVFNKLQDKTSIDEIKGLLANMDQGPTGLVGLTRGLLALTLVLALAFATFHLVVFTPAKVPDIADKLLMLLAGTLTAITGFYFGSKAATEAAQRAPATDGQGQTTGIPKILKVDQSSGSTGRQLILTGDGFGPTQGRGTVTLADKDAAVKTWNNHQITVTVPDEVTGDNVNVVVTNDASSSSAPYPIKITP